jgi:phosphatidylserine decarboxylase
LRGIPIAREGLPLIGLSLGFAILLFVLGIPLLPFVCFLFFLFFLFFFRNPKRVPLNNDDSFISPADGKIIDIGDMDESEFIHGRARRICIFMSPLDVHVNRAPCEGKVLKVQHRKGEFALAFKKDIDKENERNYILIDHGGEKVLLVQVAGFLARRIISYVKEGDFVKKGDPVGMIVFGSRVDIYFPEEYETVVKSGMKVKAGVTSLAKARSKVL